MLKESKNSKRIIAFMIGFLLVFSQLGVLAPQTVSAQTDDDSFIVVSEEEYDAFESSDSYDLFDESGTDTGFEIIEDEEIYEDDFETADSDDFYIEDASAGEVEETGGTRAAQDLTVLAFSSDVHNKSGNQSANRLATWIDKIKGIYGTIEIMAFGGDMADAQVGASTFWSLTQADIDQMNAKGVPAVYTTGNHEYSPGSINSNANDTTAKYTINAEGKNGSNYLIYCLGSDSSSQSYSSSQVTTLTNYLKSVGNSKPIFIITHFPLHYGGGRSTSNAASVFDLLNNAAENWTPNDTSDDKKIVFLWGHNHTNAHRNETHYDEIFKPGDTLQYASGSNDVKTLKFYYAAAGCMSDSEYGSGSGAVKGKGLIITINSRNQLSFTYYDANGNDVTEGGSFTEQDSSPVTVESISVSPSQLSINEGSTGQLSVSFTPSDAPNKSVTWTSANNGIATVNANGLVTGIAAGTTTITATAVDGGCTSSCRVTVSAIPTVTYTFKGFTWSSSYNGGYTAVANYTGSDNSSRTVSADVSSNTTNPTCTEAGSTFYTAKVTAAKSLDGQQHTDTKTESIAALGHSFGNWTLTKEATCTEKGVETRTCSRCDKKETREIDMIAHTVEIIPAVPATCTSAGLTEGQKCSVCKKILVVQEEAPALGHSLAAHVANAATCTEPGNTTYWSCSRCGKYFGDSDGTTVIGEDTWLTPELGHDWGAVTYTWADDNRRVTAKRTCRNDKSHVETEDGVVTVKVTKEASCEEKGETTYSAVFTNEAFAAQTKTVANIESSGHSLVKTDAKAATCTKDGNSTYYTCSKCGKYFSDANGENEIEKNSWVIAKAAHTYGDWTVKTAATCIKKGVETRTCSVCGKVESREIKLAGHVLTKTAAKDATCTKDGNNTYYTCDTCGKYFSDSKGKKEIEEGSWVKEKLGHDYGEYIVTKKASGVNSGILTSTCSRCSKTKTKVVNPCLVKVTSSKGTEATVSWNKVNGAERYKIYFENCGVEEMKLVKTVKDSAAGSYTHTGLSSGKYYRFQVVAQQQVTVDGEKKWKDIATSYTAHFVSGNQNAKKTYTNVKSISVTSGTAVTVKVGKTSTIKAEVTLVKSDMKLLNTSHAAKFRYASSNSAIATVDKEGKIKGVKAGSCKIYVIGVNGVYKTITVTVD